MYLGLMIILIGSGILLGSLSPFLVIPVFFLIIQEGFIKHEEPFLENIFGDEYREYKSRIRRWL
jgi:protein-S-isoprenylcysteine O-methyltransferase Ste14